MLNRSRSASVQFRTPSSFLLVSTSFLFFFSFCFQRPPFVSFLPAFLFFSVHMCPFFSAQNNSLFSPKTFFSAQNVFASAQNLFQFSPHHCFSFFFFLLVLFSAPPFFFLLFSTTFSFSCQLPRPKIFSLDASHFFYLNKSLFSSNLE